MEREMTERRKFLMQVLVKVQNHRAHASRDILTIATLMTDDELSAHLGWAERMARKIAERQ
jgi:hypothetical protein